MKRFSIIMLLLFAGCATTTGPAVDKTKMAEGYYMKGMSHFQQKNYELASVEFNRSLQSDDNYKQSYYMLGIVNDYQGKLDDSVKYYKEAIARDPNYSEAYNALGAAYSKQQKWADALKYFKKALENKLYPTPHVPYLNIGRIYMAQKNYDKAVDAYREAKRYATQDFIIYELGTALFEAGRTKEAISEFQEGVGIAPQNANLRYSLALALLKDGNKKAALADFKKAAELAPGSEIAQKAKDYIKTLR
jgi:pentatricopeptide repeat protein